MSDGLPKVESPVTRESASPSGLPHSQGSRAFSASGRRKRRYMVAGAVVAVGAVLLLAIGGLIPGVGPLFGPAKVTVTSVTLTFTPSTNPCFSVYGSTSSLTAAAQAKDTISVYLTDEAPDRAHQCTVQSIQVDTRGFSLVSENTPLTVPNFGKGLLIFTVGFPSAAYDGPLNLTAPVTFQGPNVNVTGIHVAWSPSSNSCGVYPPTANPSSLSGFSGGSFNGSAVYWDVSPSSYCSVTSVTVAPSGFTVLSATVPDPVGANNLDGVSFEIGLPATNYTGALNVTLYLTVT